MSSWKQSLTQTRRAIGPLATARHVHSSESCVGEYTRHSRPCARQSSAGHIREIPSEAARNHPRSTTGGVRMVRTWYMRIESRACVCLAVQFNDSPFCNKSTTTRLQERMAESTGHGGIGKPSFWCEARMRAVQVFSETVECRGRPWNHSFHHAVGMWRETIFCKDLQTVRSLRL